MSLSSDEIDKIARLARLQIQPEESTALQGDLSAILALVGQMQAVDTTDIEPMAHPLAMSQRLRPDQVSEVNQRELYQSVASQVEEGLYLVPKVIG